MNPGVQYTTQATREVAEFLDSVETTGQSTFKAVQDSGVAAKVPESMQRIVHGMSETDAQRVYDSLDAAISTYQATHGTPPTADVVEAAMQQGLVAMRGIDTNGAVLDDVRGASASSSASAPTGLQPNRAIVAILTGISEAIPFATSLPVDIGSNKALLAVLSHQSGTAFGDYVAGGLMDGVSLGGVFASAQRSARVDITGAAPFATKLTATNLTADPGYCDTAATGVPLLRGRTTVFVAGVPVASDAALGNGTTSSISGAFTHKGVSYTVAGTVTLATGVVSITAFTPALPAGTKVYVQGAINYESAPALIPQLGINVDTYELLANPWRVMTKLGIDTRTQLRNELGLDGEAQALVAIRNQMAAERHYQALRMVEELAVNNSVAYDFGYDTQIAQKTRAMIWQDFASVIANADQQMAEATMDHGITHLYVPSFIAAQMQSLPSELFVSSGLAARPGIFRVGRLFGKYEVYYSPRGPKQDMVAGTAKILAVGRSQQVGRCPIVLGEAVSPTFLPLATNSDLAGQSAIYARDFTSVNPHGPSALGCAEINITDLN